MNVESECDYLNERVNDCVNVGLPYRRKPEEHKTPKSTFLYTMGFVLLFIKYETNRTLWQ